MGKHHYRSFLLLIPILLLCLVSACENDRAVVKKIASQKEASAETGKDVEVLYSNLGKIKAKMDAPTLNRYHVKEPYTEMPDGIKLSFFDPNGNVNSHLTADYGISYDKSGQMIARNNVEAINIYGDKLNTEELVWNQNTQKISSDKAVTITTKDEIIFGDGFESDRKSVV